MLCFYFLEVQLHSLSVTWWKNSLQIRGTEQAGHSRSHLLALAPPPQPALSCYDNRESALIQADALTTDLPWSSRRGYTTRKATILVCSTSTLDFMTIFDHSDISCQQIFIYRCFTYIGLCLLHLPPALHPFILGDVPCKHLPPPFLQHVGERQCGHDGERLFQQEVDLRFWQGKTHNIVYDVEREKVRKLSASGLNILEVKLWTLSRKDTETQFLRYCSFFGHFSKLTAEFLFSTLHWIWHLWHK